MALRTPPSWLQNASHPAENDRLTTQAIYATTGIVGSSSLAVTQNSPTGMSVLVAAGWGAIVGTTQSNMGTYQFYNDASATATITTANASNPRIDRVCVTVNDAYYTGSLNNVTINVVAGTPAASPVAPATPANSISLATVLVGAAVTQILNANITDTRVNVTTNLPVGDITDVQAGSGISVASSTGPIPVVSVDPTVPYGYTTTATAAGTTTLTSASNRTQMFTGTTTQTIVLPVASTMTLGQAFTIHNNSTGALTIQSSGANTVVTIPAGNTYLITCILTSGTTAASWDADFTGTTSTTGIGSTVLSTYPTLTSPKELTTISATAATGTIQFDWATQGVLYYTSAATAAFTLNLRGNATTTFNSLTSVGEAITFVFMNTNTATVYFTATVTIDGAAQTIKWQGGTAPTSGNANSVDVYTFTVLKTAATPTYTVIGSQTRFA